MKIIKSEIRHIGYTILELSETEVQSIIDAFEEVCYLKNVPFSKIMGTRKEIYDKLYEILNTPCQS